MGRRTCGPGGAVRGPARGPPWRNRRGRPSARGPGQDDGGTSPLRDGAVRTVGLLSRFRVEFCECLHEWADVLFEFTDGVLCAGGLVKILVGLFSAVGHWCGHGVLYAALAVTGWSRRGCAARRRVRRCRRRPRGGSCSSWVCRTGCAPMLPPAATGSSAMSTDGATAARTSWCPAAVLLRCGLGVRPRLLGRAPGACSRVVLPGRGPPGPGRRRGHCHGRPTPRCRQAVDECRPLETGRSGCPDREGFRLRRRLPDPRSRRSARRTGRAPALGPCHVPRPRPRPVGSPGRASAPRRWQDRQRRRIVQGTSSPAGLNAKLGDGRDA
jgi:hypothetical protein